MSKRRLRPEEQRAWARVTRSVKPIAKPTAEAMPTLDDLDHVGRSATGSSGSPKPTWTLPTARLDTPYPTRLGYPANRSGEKRIRRGQTAIAARLDLHGQTQLAARDSLLSFVAHHRKDGARCVLVITGKGKAGGGVIRSRFLDWLGEDPVRAHVSGYAQANRKHGGSGAWYVFLRRL